MYRAPSSKFLLIGTFFEALRLTIAGARLVSVRLAAKIGISTLALLLAALPVMACTVPGAVMSAAERDCCKRMANQCGHSNMAKSHGCCEIQTAPNDFHALKASFSQLDRSLIDFHPQPVALQTIADSHLAFTTNTTFAAHSPPGLVYSATTVLRI